MERQKTISREARASGVGIHTGKPVELRFKPAEKDSGIKFVRTDLADKPVIRATISNVIEESLTQRRTSLGCNSAQIHTVEHLLSALFGLGIDNLIVEVSAEEIPALDGAGLNFYQILSAAGIAELNGPKEVFRVQQPIYLSQDDASLAIFPNDNFRICYTLSYPEVGLNQYIDLTINQQTFAQELAPCRTFCLDSEVDRLRDQGLGKGATVENTIVVGKNGVIKGRATFADEFARHKVLDLIGDFCLLTSAIKGHVLAVKSGHPLNISFLQRLDRLRRKSEVPAKVAVPEDTPLAPPFGIKQIMQVLPHRYPFLLVDKVLKLEAGRQIVGVKNVTANEQFFTGHFPGRPVLPGVLIIEAMAQTAGILMLSRPENRGKLAYFMSIDKVKFRKTVVPGDQLIMKVDVVRIKSRIIQIRGLAFVDGKIAAEAEMIFSLVSKNG